MLDFKAQSQFIDATAAMMQSCVAAATSTFAASAWQGLSLWSDLLRAANNPFSPPPERYPYWAGAPQARLSVWPSPSNWLAMPQLTRWPAWPWLHDDRAVFMDMPWTPFADTWWLGPSFTAWAPLGDWTAWGSASFKALNGLLDQAPLMAPRTAARFAPDYGYASYRSAGGHAVAQIAAPAAELAGLTATAVLTPMHNLLGVWRAAFGN
jgi:hypothetical protein